MSLKSLFKRFSQINSIIILIVSLSFSSVWAQDKAAIDKGKDLFSNNCTACHDIHKDKVGPALKDIKKRRDLTWIKKFVRNSQQVIKVEKDPYAVALYQKYNSTEMTAFASFKDDEIEALVAYIMDESSKPPVAVKIDGGGDGKETIPVAAQKDYSDIILILTVVTLALVVVTLLVFVSVLRKYLKDKESTLNEDDKEIVNQGFDVMAVIKHKAFIIIVALLLTGVAVKSCWVGMMSIGIEQNYRPIQPIPYSHKLHAGTLKIDCGYCHTGAYRGKQANIPGVNICMNCHSQVKQGPKYGSEAIARLREYYEKGRPIQWVRVHNLPDLAYFNHSQHTVAGGIECTKCHGQIDTMEVVHQNAPLTMGWCINCHRETAVNGKDNAYYDRLLKYHNDAVATNKRKGDMKVQHIGGLECSKCHY